MVNDRLQNDLLAIERWEVSRREEDDAFDLQLRKDELAIKESEDRKRARRKLLMDMYGWKLVGSSGVKRREVARRAAREVTDSEDRRWLANQVMETSKALGWKRRRDLSKEGFLKRFGRKLYELPQAAAEGAISIGEDFAGMGRGIAGQSNVRRDIQFTDLLEAAYQYGDPKQQNEDNLAFKTLRESARLLPQIGTGAAAFRLGGAKALMAQAGSQMFAPIREQLVAEGADPVKATAISALTAGLSGVVEAAVPIPGAGKGGLSVAGRELGGMAAEKLALKGFGRETIETAGRFGAEYLGEVGEEFVQGGLVAAGSLTAAADVGKLEDRSLAEIPQEAVSGLREAALPLLPISLGGGGLHIAGRIQQQRARAQIEQFAARHKAPSRREWRRLGLPPEHGATAKDRLSAVKEITKTWAKIDKEQIEEDRVLSEEERALREKIEEGRPIPETPVVKSTEAPVEQPSLQQEVADFLAEETGAQKVKLEPADVVAGLSEEEAKQAMKSPNKEYERRREAARETSLEKAGFWQRVGDRAKAMWQGATRAQIEIPNEMATANEVWRLKRNVQNAATDHAIRDVAAITKDLGVVQNELLERFLVTKNQLRSLYMKTPEPLRLGQKNIEEVEAYGQHLAVLVEATPEVKGAALARGRMVRNLTQQLVEEKLLGEDALEDVESYVHQEVSLYRNAFRAGLPGKKKGFQKARVTGPEELGEEYDYDTSYIAPEVAWMADAHAVLMTRRYNEKLVEEYDQFEEFDVIAREEDRTVEDVAEENGHGIMSIRDVIGDAKTISSSVLGEFERAMIKEYGITSEEMDLTEGEQSQKVSLPIEIIKQIKHDTEAGEPHWITEISRDMMSAWKAWTLMNPKRIVGYNLRNISGDLDPVLAADPKIILHVAQALRDLTQFSQTEGKLSPTLEASRDYGVINSGFAGTEVEEVGNLPEFRRLGKKGFRRFGQNPIAAYANIAKAGTQFRENILRHAAFLRYLKQVRAGQVDHFGASREVAVREIQKRFGDEAAAAHLARNLLGDYGNMSVMGNYLRNHLLPFWSFVEINIKRYPRILQNAFKAGKGRTATGAILAKIAVARIGMMYGAMWLWNNFIIPAVTDDDDEADLTPMDRANPHILLGRNDDGTVRVFRNVGAIGDLLEWFGINEAISMLPKLKNKQIDYGDIGSEMSIAGIEKLVGLLRPDIKGGYEVLTGESLFPEPTRPRAIARGEAVANIVGLAEEYKAIKGQVFGGGSRARRHYLQRWLVGIVDPRRAALLEIYGARRDFLRKEGSPERGVFPISEYRMAREAAINGNRAAFNEWRRAFIGRHGMERGAPKFFAFLRRLDPIASRLADSAEWRFENQFLSNEQREKLRIAREYSAELRDTLAQWWVDEVREKSS